MLEKIKKLGPGLLFAGAAIGVSHLVQSVKAGAGFGLGLLWAMILALLCKYPAFAFGSHYPAVTQKNLLQGYQKIGKAVLPIFALLTLATMFTIQSCVTVVTASIASGLFGVSLDLNTWSIGILLILCLILIFGQYSILDRIIKVVVISLSITTIVAVILAFFKVENTLTLSQIFPQKAQDITFLIAFMGWMPGPMDISVWQSLWTQEKQKESPEKITLETTLFDFKVGYIGTFVIGVCFLLMGALLMYHSGEEFSTKGSVFANQFLDMYANTLGNFARIFIGIAALCCMISTTLTCLDASPRCMSQSINLMGLYPKKTYLTWLLILVFGTAYIVYFQANEMAFLIKIATVISFVTAPIYAILNHLVIFSKHTPKEQQPSFMMKIWSILGIVFLLGFSIWYITLH